MDVRLLVKRVILIWAILAVIVALLGKVSVAETNGGQTAANFLLIGAGARAAGMGGAFTPVSTGVVASYWNPAGLTELEETEVHLSHFAWYQDMSVEYGAVAYRVSEAAVLSASVTYFNYGTILGYDIDGNATGEISAYDLAGAVSLGYRIDDRIAVGLTTKVITQKIDDINGSTFAVDIGANYTRERWGIGAVLANFGPNISFEGVAERLPTTARFGALVYPVEDRLLVAVELEKRFEGATVLRNGFEFSFDQQYFLRAGYNYYPGDEAKNFGTGMSVGAGLHLAGMEFDYAYTFGEKYSSEDLHRFTLTLKIGPR